MKNPACPSRVHSYRNFYPILCIANGAEVIRMSTFNFTFYIYKMLSHYRVFVHVRLRDNLIQKLTVLEFSITCDIIEMSNQIYPFKQFSACNSQ